MFTNTKAFSSFSVDDIEAAKRFYGNVLGITISEEMMGEYKLLYLHFIGGVEILIYPKPDHIPATFTVLNFPVTDIHKAVKELAQNNIRFEHYEGTDVEGITHNEGPLIAWFKDPAGNFLSVIEDRTLERKLELDSTIHAPVEKVFDAWIKGELLEQWSYPEGMSLAVEQIRPKILGKYIFRYSGEAGVFFATGIFKEIILQNRLIYTCKVKGPDGSVIMNTLVRVEFLRQDQNTLIKITQEGFEDKKTLKECEKGWREALENLNRFLELRDEGVVLQH